MLRHSIVACLLFGCTGSLRPLGTSDPGPGTDTGREGGGTVPEAPAMRGVLPTYGTAGSVVVLSGGPFPADARFAVAGQPAEIVRLTETAAEIEIPLLSVDGWVDVVLASTWRGLPAVGFRYFTSAERGHGAVGAIGRYRHVGGYWPDDAEDFVRGALVLPVGPAPSWPAWRFAPALDSCALDHAPEVLDAYAPDVTTVALEGNDDARTVTELQASELPEGTPAYAIEAGYEAVAGGVPLDLEPMAGSEDWPALEVASLVGDIPGDGVIVTEPAIAGATTPLVGRSFTLAWKGPYTGEILVTLARQRWLRAEGRFELQETVTCWLQDDGVHAIPDLWTDWKPIPSDDDYDVVDFTVGRIHASGATLPHNRGSSGVVGGTFSLGQAVSK